MKEIPDPGPLPDGATPKERERHRRDTERFLTEGGRSGVSDVPAEVDPTDKRLKALQSDHTRFLELHSPVKASLWLSLLRPAKDVIHDAEMTRRFREAQRDGSVSGEYVPPEHAAIVGIGQQLVAAALGGDRQAIADIAERIEGRVGLRQGDEDPDDPAKRKQARDITERVVRSLTASRIGVRADPKVTDVVDVTPIDKIEDK